MVNARACTPLERYIIFIASFSARYCFSTALNCRLACNAGDTQPAVRMAKLKFIAGIVVIGICCCRRFGYFYRKSSSMLRQTLLRRKCFKVARKTGKRRTKLRYWMSVCVRITVCKYQPKEEGKKHPAPFTCQKQVEKMQFFSSKIGKVSVVRCFCFRILVFASIQRDFFFRSYLLFVICMTLEHAARRRKLSSTGKGESHSRK